MIKVRFAPSPTGHPHFGTARSGLFNWLFARHNNATFVLRIEDTDKERSRREHEEKMIEGLKLLGINWDEFYRQSERTDIYKEYLQKIIDSGNAYPCFCTQEEIEAKRKDAEINKTTYKYDGKCGLLSREQSLARIQAGESFVIRVRTPKEKIIFNDLIRGDIEFDGSLMDDMIIAKNMNEPLYNFSVVVDDALMQITHVIRGDDHISNTPKQIIIFKALGFNIPVYAHIPMILTKDRRKMSKRDGENNIFDFINEGYLPEALRNFIVLLGWHPKEDNEIFTTEEELINAFELERVQKGGAAFDLDKLNWLNHHYINNVLDEDELLQRASNFVPNNWKLTSKIINSVKSRLNKLGDIKEAVSFYFELKEYNLEDLIWKDDLNTKSNLEKIKEVIENISEDNFDQVVEKNIIEIIPEGKKGNYLWPLRMALSGEKTSPSPFEIMIALGKEESLKRIKRAINKF